MNKTEPDMTAVSQLPASVAAPAEKTKLKILLFSGGSGTHSITEALLKHPQIDLTIVINAYDDGHSTGRLRKFIPGMLGPSDVRKNINRLMPQNEECYRSLRWLSDHRLPAGVDYGQAMKLVRALGAGDELQLPDPLDRHFAQMTIRQSRRFCRFLQLFLAYAEEQERVGNFFPFTDCSIGNLLFAGCYLGERQDFNRAIAAFSAFYDVHARLLNVTRGENLFLIARNEDGSILRSEAEIVSVPNAARIKELLLLPEDTYRAVVEPGSPLPAACICRNPEINPEAAEALRTADVIIYGPGTQHSSLLPTYLTRGVAEAILENNGADKIFIANLRRDMDIQHDDANDLARKFLQAMRRNEEVRLEWKDAVTHFFFQRSDERADSGGQYIPFDAATFFYPLDTVKLKDWELHDGRHAGGYVVDELQQIVQSRIGISLQPMHHLVSIIVPALNEEKTVEDALKHLLALDFQHLDLGKEIILVDGGSTDRTAEIAASVRSVKVHRLLHGRGRGEALRAGIEMARGTIVVFFPADMEYAADDIHPIVTSIARSGFDVVFGTRAVRCANLTQRLKTIYGDSRGLYLISKYGGMLLSTATLFLYNRYVSDTLTSIKGFNAKVLRSLHLSGCGIDLDTEIVAKVCRQNRFILEIPVDYHPRTRAQGKKITAADGLKALGALLRFRFGRPGV